MRKDFSPSSTLRVARNGALKGREGQNTAALRRLSPSKEALIKSPLDLIVLSLGNESSGEK